MVKVTELVDGSENSGSGISIKDIKDFMSILRELKGMGGKQPQQQKPYPTERVVVQSQPQQQPQQIQQQGDSMMGFGNLKEKIAGVLTAFRIVRGGEYTVKDLKKWIKQFGEEGVDKSLGMNLGQVKPFLAIMREDMTSRELIDWLRGSESEPKQEK